MDLLPIGLAFVSGLTGGIIVLHQLFQDRIETEVVKHPVILSTSRAATRDVQRNEVSATITNQLNNLEQQVSISLRLTNSPSTASASDHCCSFDM